MGAMVTKKTTVLPSLDLNDPTEARLVGSRRISQLLKSPAVAVNAGRKARSMISSGIRSAAHSMVAANRPRISKLSLASVKLASIPLCLCFVKDRPLSAVNQTCVSFTASAMFSKNPLPYARSLSET